MRKGANEEKRQECICKYKKLLKDGKNIVIYDFDGPRDANKNPICKEITIELLKEKINDIKHPFGHGYIVGAVLCDIKPEEYTQ